LISSIWNWAARRDETVFVDNPAKGIDPYPRKSGERFLSTKELGRLGDALVRAETVGLPYSVDETKPKNKHAPKLEHRFRKFDVHAVAALRLLILTGARLREILHARWTEVDFERSMIHLSDSKTGRKPIYL
jgi:integrase